MPAPNDFPTRGAVTRRSVSTVVFKPAGTNYELHLLTAAPYEGPMDEPVYAILRVNARKVYTVPSGGNFVAPIFGPPRIVQGRVKFANERQLVVRAGANFVVELPAGDSAIDLNSGRIAEGTMVNVVALPGALIEFVNEKAPAATTTA